MLSKPDWLPPVLDRFPAEAEPDGAALAPHHFYTGLAIAFFGFVSVWAYYPRLGAIMALLGLAIAADDAVSHAFGVWTPLDWLWNNHIRPWIMDRHDFERGPGHDRDP